MSWENPPETKDLNILKVSQTYHTQNGEKRDY